MIFKIIFKDTNMTEISTKEQVSSLIDFVFQKLTVSHLLWDGKAWYSHTLTEWRDTRQVLLGEVGEWDPDYPCYGYFQHKFDNKEGDPHRLEPARWLENTDEYVELPYTPHKVKKIEDFTHIFFSRTNYNSPYNLDTKIRLFSDMNISNSMGHINPDHRGSNHLGIEIDHLFDGSVDIEADEYTIAQFADLAWRVKGNKFDNNYEAVFSMDNGGEVDFEDGKWYVGLCVDHGS